MFKPLQATATTKQNQKEVAVVDQIPSFLPKAFHKKNPQHQLMNQQSSNIELITDID